VLEASRISDSYSLADTLGVESTALEIATRATRDTLREVPLTTTGGAQSESGFNFPREWKVRRAILKCSSEVGKYIEIEMKWRSLTRSFQDSNLLYGYYEPLINRQREFRNKSRLHYLKSINGVIPDELQEPHHHPFIKERLGGPLMEISVDSRMVSDIGPEGNDYSLPTTDDSYFKMYAALAQDDESDSASEFDDDPIVDSDEPDDLTFEDDPSFENALMNFSQKRLQPTASSLSQGKNAGFFNDFNDDDFSE
jgi:cell cycle checkpoint protein